MVRKVCISKAHFAKCETHVEGRPLKVTWKCDHCGEHVISGSTFKPAYARIHLAADGTNGLCSNLCTSADDHAEGRQLQFRKLIQDLKEKKEELSRKRKQQQLRLEKRQEDAAEAAASSKKKKRKMKQPKLEDLLKAGDCSAADFAVAQWAFAHDIPAHALQGIYWKEMTKKMAQVPSACYSPMNPQKLQKTMLPLLKNLAEIEQKAHLAHAPESGRTLTGDGATKKVPLINFLVHVPGKGVTLLDVMDCTGHMGEGGTKDAL